MRLTDYQVLIIQQLARQISGIQSRVRVFGSRLDDAAHGGALDPMLELTEPFVNPALMGADVCSSVSFHARA